MIRLIRSFFRRFGDAALKRELEQVRQQLLAEQSKLRIAELERERLIEVIERDRRRVAAETAIFSRRQADAEDSPQTRGYTF